MYLSKKIMNRYKSTKLFDEHYALDNGKPHCRFCMNYAMKFKEIITELDEQTGFVILVHLRGME